MKYLVVFVHKHLDFRLPELDAVLQLAGLRPKDVYDGSRFDPEHPYLEVDLESDDQAHLILSRTVLVRGMYELWGQGRTLDELVAAVDACPEHVKMPHFHESVSWSLKVAAFGSTLTEPEQEIRRRRFSHLPLLGPIRLRAPDTQLVILEHYGARPEDTAGPPKRLYFLRELGRGQRRLVHRFTLKERKYLGPTSMDTELSLIMANQALARPGALVFDPFVGTGSLLVAATAFGARCLGADIDIRVLRGKCDVNPFTNFEQYRLTPPDIVRADASMPPFRPMTMLDAILCDPPYGIRAGARKSGSRRESVKAVPTSLQRDHIPQTQPYSFVEILVDLLDFAARTLRMHGRLVFIVPTAVQEYDESELPHHPMLRIVANSEQRLTIRLARRFVTMEKVAEYDPHAARAFFTSVDTGADSSFSNLYEKLRRSAQEDSEAAPVLTRKARRDRKRQAGITSGSRAPGEGVFDATATASATASGMGGTGAVDAAGAPVAALDRACGHAVPQ